ncbi:hypothetical protein H4R33_002372 [Dimargaris cristalligena]|nr:hypothetical protein H4R33_002372 [Dimargaris cristalligena]
MWPSPAGLTVLQGLGNIVASGPGRPSLSTAALPDKNPYSTAPFRAGKTPPVPAVLQKSVPVNWDGIKPSRTPKESKRNTRS